MDTGSERAIIMVGLPNEKFKQVLSELSNKDLDDMVSRTMSYEWSEDQFGYIADEYRLRGLRLPA